MVFGSKRGPIESLQAEIDKLRARRKSLHDKVDAAKAVHDDAVRARSELLAGEEFDDDRALGAADARVSEAQRTLAGTSDAITLLDGKIAEVEKLLATERDRVARERECSRVDELLHQFGDATDGLLKALGRFERAAAPLGLEGTNCAAHAQIFKEHIRSEAPRVLRGGQDYRKQIVDGTRAPPQPRPAQPALSKSEAAA